MDNNGKQEAMGEREEGGVDLLLRLNSRIIFVFFPNIYFIRFGMLKPEGLHVAVK